MQNKPFAFTVTLTGTYTTNLLYPGTFTGGAPTRAPVGWIPQGDPYLIIKHVRAMNSDTSARTIRTALGASGATPAATNVIFFPLDRSIPASSEIDWYGSMRIDGSNANQYIVGGASTASVVTLQIEGEVGFA